MTRKSNDHGFNGQPLRRVRQLIEAINDNLGGWKGLTFGAVLMALGALKGFPFSILVGAIFFALGIFLNLAEALIKHWRL